MMQRLICSVALLVMLVVNMPSLAQQSKGEVLDDPELTAARELLQAGREEIIRDEIRLTESEAAAFWPTYEKYRADVLKVRDQHAQLVADYLQAYRAGTVPEDDAERFVDEYLDIKSDLLKVQKRHLRYFRKALPARKAARFFQLENKLDAELEVQLARFVPLIDAN